LNQHWCWLFPGVRKNGLSGDEKSEGRLSE
jgi:hypothetical protein